MNLTNFEEQDVAPFTLTAPDGEPTDIVFMLAGPAHPARVAFEKKVGREVMRDFNKKGKASLPEDPDELFDRETKRLSTFVVGWENVALENGPLDYSQANAALLFANRKLMWVREKVSAALAGHENFIQSSATN